MLPRRKTTPTSRLAVSWCDGLRSNASTGAVGRRGQDLLNRAALWTRAQSRGTQRLYPPLVTAMRCAALLLATLGSILTTGCAHAPPPAEQPPMTDSRQQMIARIESANADAGSLRFIESTALTERLKVEKFQLANGLSVLVMEDHSAPLFAFQTWFRVGSRHEREGTTGIAHLFEHLLFKESENLGDGVFDRILELNGARVNASTWVDWTQYQESLPVGPPSLPEPPPSLLQPAPPDRLGLVVRLEADRMANMLLNDAQLEAERDVVKNERRYRVDNDPEGTMYEALYSEA